MVVAVLLASSTAVAAPTWPSGNAPDSIATLQSLTSPTSDTLGPYLVRLGESNLMPSADSAPEDLDARAWQVRRDEIAATLDRLAADGQAGAYAYDESARAFRVDLVDSARDALAASSSVSSVDLVGDSALSGTAADEAAPAPLNWQDDQGHVLDASSGVSSVAFVKLTCLSCGEGSTSVAWECGCGLRTA